MRAHRAKFDVSRPFRLITSRTAFDCLTSTEQLFPASDQNNHHSSQREEIVVPRIEVVPRITKKKSYASVPPNYIRLSSALCLPRPDAYELSEVDWLFLSGLKERFLAARQWVTEEFLQRAIVELESKAGRDNVLPRSKGWIVAYLERNYKQIANLPNFDEFASMLYNYWKSRREGLHFPLWRPLWRPADNQFNHMLAFKNRQKRSRNLRRANRVDDTELLHELNQEYLNATLICQRIQLREELKLTQIQLQFQALTQEFKSFIDTPPVIEEMTSRSDQREKVKASRNSTEEFKRKRQSIEMQVNQTPANKQLPNQRESIAYFLANVAYEAERCGIASDVIFPSTENQLSALRVAVSQTNRMIQELPPYEETEERKELEDIPSFSVRRYGDLLVRSLSSEDEEKERQPQDYLEARRRRVTSCYFGDDDQLGDVKDLRKVINSSFKRFQQANNQTQQDK